jgi:predicted nucleic acid-binding protein
LTTLVLDASVAIKWAMPLGTEPLIDQAVLLLRRYTEKEIEFLVPEIFWAEIGNVLWRGVKQSRWDGQKAEGIAREMQSRGFQSVSCDLLLPEALQIALTCDRNIYDCFYAALAKESHADLITADERLVNALAARYPVKWLGGLSA